MTSGTYGIIPIRNLISKFHIFFIKTYIIYFILIFLAKLDYISIGSRLRYKCKGKAPIGIMCVKNKENNRMILAKCTDKRGDCTTFDRSSPIDMNRLNFNC